MARSFENDIKALCFANDALDFVIVIHNVFILLFGHGVD